MKCSAATAKSSCSADVNHQALFNAVSDAVKLWWSSAAQKNSSFRQREEETHGFLKLNQDVASVAADNSVAFLLKGKKEFPTWLDVVQTWWETGSWTALLTPSTWRRWSIQAIASIPFYLVYCFPLENKSGDPFSLMKKKINASVSQRLEFPCDVIYRSK